jgi:hypothetical protein
MLPGRYPSYPGSVDGVQLRIKFDSPEIRFDDRLVRLLRSFFRRRRTATPDSKVLAMTHEYTLNTFFRMTPKDLLKQYFTKKGIQLNVPFEKLGKRDFKPILDAVLALSENDRAGVELDCREVWMLATAKGSRLIAEQAELEGLNIGQTLADLENGYARSMWLWLHHGHERGTIFFQCLLGAMSDEVPWGRALRYTVQAKSVPATGAEERATLAQGISKFYEPQGRGKQCVVEHLQRKDPLRHLYLAYPEDLPHSDLAYEGRDLKRKSRKSVFEVRFRFRPDDGTLEVSAPGPDKDAKALRDLFCRQILGLPLLPPDVRAPEHQLDKLKYRSMRFPTDPEDAIESVQIVALRLNNVNSWSRRLTIECNPDVDNILDVLDAWAGAAQNVDHMKASHAKFRFMFRGTDRRRGTKFTFTLTTPNSSNLRDDPRAQLARKYIKRWGIIPE